MEGKEYVDTCDVRTMVYKNVWLRALQRVNRDQRQEK